MGVGEPRDENARIGRQNFRGYFDDLFRRFAAAENDFGKTLAERTVHVHLRETEVGDRRGLKCAQDFFARNCSGAELFKQADGFSNGHAMTMPQECAPVTWET